MRDTVSFCHVERKRHVVVNSDCMTGFFVYKGGHLSEIKVLFITYCVGNWVWNLIKITFVKSII